MQGPNEPKRVTIRDINMSFGSMVIFMIKWSIAAIPAMIVLGIIFALVTAVLGGVIGGLMSNF